MGQTITFTITEESLKYFRYLRALMEKNELYSQMVTFFDRQAQIIAGKIVKSKLSGDPVHRRTGALARSIAGRGELIDGLPGFRIGTLRGPSIKYATILEVGTVGKGGELPTIVPKKAKALAMPVNRALTAAGVARWGGPRQAPFDFKFIPYNNKRGAIGGLYDPKEIKAAAKSGHFHLGDILPYYLLLAKADIAPRHYLRDGTLESIPKLVADLGIFLKRLLAMQRPELV